ncbi:hypothetical protein BJ165DRAFT_1468672 [Panaeolus papilionaceus]|nr:hypothetical protein BJ165DRAFT_1468672 [Panaeolus papilionaceus]
MSGSVCFEEELPEEHIIPAAQRAIELNPKNAPNGHTSGVRMTQRLALMTSKKWPSPVRLKVEFMEQTSPQLRTRIVGHMNAWSQYCDVEFREDMKNAQATVRITLLGKSYKSAVGTDIKTRNPKNPTMWLGGFTMNTSESEYRRVVRHETGHTLGFRHEHLRKDIVKWIDKDKAYAYYGSGPNGWDKPKIDANVLTGIDEKVLTATKEVDGDSIMCYFIGDLLTAKAPHFVGGRDISPKDAKLAREVYPMYVFHEIAFHDSGAIDVASYYNQVYIHKRDGTVWSWDGDSDGDGSREWSCIDDERRTLHIVAAKDRLYQKCQNGEIWLYDHSADEWTDITGGQAVDDDDDKPLEIVAFDNHVYQRRSDGHIYHYNGTRKDTWTVISPDTNAKEIFGQSGRLMQIREGMGGIWLYSGKGKEWKILRSSTKAIQLAATYQHIYSLDWEGQVAVLEDENTKSTKRTRVCLDRH